MVFLDALLVQGADIASLDKDGREIPFQGCKKLSARKDASDSLIYQLLYTGANPFLFIVEGKSLLRDVLDPKDHAGLTFLKLFTPLGLYTCLPQLNHLESIQASTYSPTEKTFICSTSGRLNASRKDL